MSGDDSPSLKEKWLRKLAVCLFGKRDLVDDTMWMEVTFANSYAVLIGYLSMAVKGLGFLVLTWSTVVLLGGFVSNLQEKDFWCLTFITLVQTAGIFDVFLTEKLSYLGYSFVGYTIWSSNNGLGTVLTVVQAVVFVILLCPLAAVYMFGLLISAGISVWRLRQQDYLSDPNNEPRNLRAALDVLYSLALLQGVIFCSKFIIGFKKESIVDRVIGTRRFVLEDAAGVSAYLQETITRCEKDPSFTKGRNLITYAVDLMGSKSPDDYLSGVRILDAFANHTELVLGKWQEKNKVSSRSDTLMEEHILMKHLIMSVSSSDILQKLLQTLDLRSMYNRETRQRAARIVASIAGGIRLEEFPRGIHCISSLISTFEAYSLVEPYERDWLHETFGQDWYRAALYQSSCVCDKKGATEAYSKMVVQGFRIIRKLATNNDNCRVMLNTPCLLRKIMAPVSSDLLHHQDLHINHVAWCKLVESSLKAIVQLTDATGQTGTTLRQEITSSKEAIRNMHRILECGECSAKMQKQVIWILTYLYQDNYTGLKPGKRQTFIETLVNIMTNDNNDKVCSTKNDRPVREDNKDKEAKGVTAANKVNEEQAKREKESIRVTAAAALVTLTSKIEASATIIIKADDNVVDNLTAMILRDHKSRSTAAQILEYLCIHYTDNDESLKKLQKSMTDAVPKVLGAIVYWGSKETNTRANDNQVSSMKLEIYVENQCGDSQDIGRGSNSSSSHQEDKKMKDKDVASMLSLCVTVCDTFISADQDLARQFDAIAQREGSLSFPMKLKGVVDKDKHPGPQRLRRLKITCKMVISMMKHRGSYDKKDLKSLMDALSSASEEMFLLDASMLFGVKRTCATPKPFRSFVSLVKEAEKLVDEHEGILS